ncbi:MAG: hypothetical protein K0M54_17700 [Pseudomonas sp.]|uniref:hypothetical protein n=1 Tax=Pseudomonas sp. TaxID=306 RepID=UPI0025D7CD44|nr:hypothetical protein [Pseudomonas sp.]MBW8355650.1 hypothetical protein [Pseudomonas sp.]
MKLLMLLVSMQILTLLSTSALAAEEKYGPFNLDGGQITCKSPSGDEIKKTQHYTTTNDRFFKEGSISIRLKSGWAPKEYKCELSAVRRQPIKVKTEAGEVEVSVIKEFDVFAGADCGTNIAQYLGKTASIECEVSAVVVKYSNQ